MGRIVRPADFQRVLGTPPRARSRHFALHHLAQAPSRPSRAAPAVPGSSTELSTAGEQAFPHAVEDLGLVAPLVPRLVPPLVPPPAPALTGRWLGMVVPKRHAKRSVTRSLIKRQIRNAVAEAVRLAEAEATANGAGQGLAPGLWVVRLRAPIDRSQFPSAASEALRRRLHDELRTVVAQAARRHG